MSYDDVKRHGRAAYTGMRVGGSHRWRYPDGVWRERKVAPDRWAFTFEALKERAEPAPPGTGAPPGTAYHWFIVANQWARKLDADTYETFMEGAKHKVAHRRPHWGAWSSDYADQEPVPRRVARILRKALQDMEAGAAVPPGSPGRTNPNRVTTRHL